VYLVDTNTLYYYWNGNPVVVQHYDAVPSSAIFICDTVAAEVIRRRLNLLSGETGYLKGGNATMIQAHEYFVKTLRLLNDMQVIPYTQDVEDGYIKLRKVGGNISWPDCRIAATALVHGLKVVTSNLAHFRKLLPEEQ
jgi:predicted nucleic acid-binding protein